MQWVGLSLSPKPLPTTLLMNNVGRGIAKRAEILVLVNAASGYWRGETIPHFYP